MARSSRVQHIVAQAALNGGSVAVGAAALGALGFAVVKVEAVIARQIVGEPTGAAPLADGIYEPPANTLGAAPVINSADSSTRPPLNLVVLGDSTAAGLGSDDPQATVGPMLAKDVAAYTRGPVKLTTAATVGAESIDLGRQLANALDTAGAPDIAIILVGANDVTHRADRALAIAALSDCIDTLNAMGTRVVVGTCPDLGTIKPVRPPLRQLIRRWSRDLAAAQAAVATERGAAVVSLGDVLGPEFAANPEVLFSKDQFHPSAEGYAHAAAALSPATLAACDHIALAP